MNDTHQDLTAPKYKLQITFDVAISARRRVRVTRQWVWDERDDALACKALMEKATSQRGCTVSFSEFTEEKPL